jgi:hypothetical protein
VAGRPELLGGTRPEGAHRAQLAHSRRQATPELTRVRERSSRTGRHLAVAGERSSRTHGERVRARARR